MPIIKSAIKRMHQTTKRRARNLSLKRDIKAAVKQFAAKPAASSLSAAQSELDTAVKKGLLKRNTAARRIARLSRDAKAAGVKPELTKKSTTKAATKTATTAKADPTKKTPAKKNQTVKKPATKQKKTA